MHVSRYIYSLSNTSFSVSSWYENIQRFPKAKLKFSPKVRGKIRPWPSAIESKLNILEDLTLEKSWHPVIAFLRDWENLLQYVLTLDLIENAM